VERSRQFIGTKSQLLQWTRRMQDAEFVKLGKLDSLLAHEGFQCVLRSVAKLSHEEIDAMVFSN
jgi:hypothetical protein